MSLVELVDSGFNRDKVWYAANYAHVWEYADKCGFAHGWYDWRNWVEDISNTWVLNDLKKIGIFR